MLHGKKQVTVWKDAFDWDRDRDRRVLVCIRTNLAWFRRGLVFCGHAGCTGHLAGFQDLKRSYRIGIAGEIAASASIGDVPRDASLVDSKQSAARSRRFARVDLDT